MEKIVRRIDKNGRIVLPIDLRKNFGIGDGEEILIGEINGYITLKKNICTCRICNTELKEKGQFSLCKKCIEAIKNT